jgi:hypothetical protein
MSTEITFEEILQAAQKLNPQQKALLAQSLEIPPLDMGPTREELIAELEALRAAGAFDHVESLRNKYANPALDALTDAQLSADIHEAATEWEKELDEFFRDEN